MDEFRRVDPVDWVLLPREPTREMWAASGNAVVRLLANGNHNHDKITEAVFEALIATAPAPATTPFSDGAVEALRDLADLPTYLRDSVRSHIRIMYPEAVKAAAGTFLLSVGNHVSNFAHAVIMRVLKDIGAPPSAPAAPPVVEASDRSHG